MTDAHAVRMYRTETKRHQDRTRRAIQDLQREVSQLRADPASLSHAVHVATSIGLVIEALSALKTAADMGFLAEDA